MILSHTGESRVRGYLYVLERAMHASLPPAVVADAVREVESHIRERVAETQPLPDERAALEHLLSAFGTPMRVARAYSLELSVDEALVTGRIASTLRVIWLMASRTLAGFVAALFLFTGYVAGLGFLVVGVLTVILPDRVGMVVGNGVSFGPYFPGPGRELYSGWGVLFLCAALGLTCLVVTQKGARAWMRWLRTKMASRALVR
jgi:uncharacterized membrane protein